MGVIKKSYELEEYKRIQVALKSCLAALSISHHKLTTAVRALTVST